MPGALVLSRDERTIKKDLIKNTSERLRLSRSCETRSIDFSPFGRRPSVRVAREDSIMNVVNESIKRPGRLAVAIGSLSLGEG